MIRVPYLSPSKWLGCMLCMCCVVVCGGSPTLLTADQEIEIEIRNGLKDKITGETVSLNTESVTNLEENYSLFSRLVPKMVKSSDNSTVELNEGMVKKKVINSIGFGVALDVVQRDNVIVLCERGAAIYDNNFKLIKVIPLKPNSKNSPDVPTIKGGKIVQNSKEIYYLMWDGVGNTVCLDESGKQRWILEWHSEAAFFGNFIGEDGLEILLYDGGSFILVSLSGEVLGESQAEEYVKNVHSLNLEGEKNSWIIYDVTDDDVYGEVTSKLRICKITSVENETKLKGKQIKIIPVKTYSSKEGIAGGFGVGRYVHRNMDCIYLGLRNQISIHALDGKMINILKAPLAGPIYSAPTPFDLGVIDGKSYITIVNNHPSDGDRFGHGFTSIYIYENTSLIYHEVRSFSPLFGMGTYINSRKNKCLLVGALEGKFLEYEIGVVKEQVKERAQ